MSSRQNRNKRKLIAELRKMPLVQLACSRSGVSRATYYRWRKDDPDFKAESDEALEEGTEAINDLAESRVITGINNGDQKYVFYWLNNRHSKYNIQKAPHPPTSIDLLEAELKREIEKYEQLMRAFVDDPANLFDDNPRKIEWQRGKDNSVKNDAKDPSVTHPL